MAAWSSRRAPAQRSGGRCRRIFACLPGAGLCATTVPLGCSDGTLTTLVLRPAWRSVAVACAAVVPTTSGTVTGSLPFDTTSDTDEPSFSFAPPLGSCETTMPAFLSENSFVTSVSKPAPVKSAIASDSLSPTTSGTVSRGGPFETASRTVSPSSTFVPASGLCANTIPRGFALASRAVSGSSPASRTDASALSWRKPTTAGTVFSSSCVK